MALFENASPFAIVWDADDDKQLAKFKNGLFETKNKKVVDKLLKMGYKIIDNKETMHLLELTPIPDPALKGRGSK